MPLLMSALWSCFVFTQCALKTVGLQQQQQRQQGFFPKWQSKYISSFLPLSSKILISVRSTLAGWPLIKQAFLFDTVIWKEENEYCRLCVWQQSFGVASCAATFSTTWYLKHSFYIIISDQIDVRLPHRGRPWRCPRGPCCSPRSPEPGCSRPPTCLTRTGCRFHSGSTPARLPPRGFHLCWSHAGPDREGTTVLGLPRYIIYLYQCFII